MTGFTTPDGIRLHYLDEGEGLPVVAIPGLTRAGTDFDFVAPHLGGIRLIRPDLRGRGRSDHADPATYTVAQEAQDIVALIDHLGLESAAILGTSRGGLIALVLAAMARDRLKGVAFNDIGPVVEAEGLAHIRSYLGRRPPQRTLEEVARARMVAMTAFADVPLSRWREEAERLFVQTPEGVDLRYDPRLREAVLAGMDQPAPDLWPLFDALDGLPLALIRGANSDILSAQTAVEMARRRPDMIHVTLAGRGHIPFLDEPEAIGALRGWLDRMR